MIGPPRRHTSPLAAATGYGILTLFVCAALVPIVFAVLPHFLPHEQVAGQDDPVIGWFVLGFVISFTILPVLLAILVGTITYVRARRRDDRQTATTLSLPAADVPGPPPPSTRGPYPGAPPART